MIRIRSYFSTLGLAALLLVGGTLRASYAANLVVNNVEDSDSTCTAQNCSLREAVKAANATVGDDTIDVVLDGSQGELLSLGLGELNVTGSGRITISAPVRAAIGGSGANRLFKVSSGAGLTLDNFILESGNAQGARGGAILNSGGEVTLTRCWLRGNFSPLGGGAIQSDGGQIALDRCNLMSNSATDDASLGEGGAINLVGASASITASTFSGNMAAQAGSVLRALNSTVSFTNSTLSGNEVGGGMGLLKVEGGSLSLNSCTLTNSLPSTLGSGARGGIVSTNSTVTLTNTILAGNSSEGGWREIIRTGGQIVNGGFNLIGNNEGVADVFPTGPYVGTPAAPLDPRLAPLQQSAPDIYTHAPLPGSPILDAGNSAIGTDQRGFPRPNDLPPVKNAIGGNGSDIGAFESSAVLQTGTTLVVTKSEDGAASSGVCGVGDCSLRDAIATANVLTARYGSANYQIVFDETGVFGSPQSIAMDGGPLEITSSVSIVGPQAGLTINGGGQTIFVVRGESLRISDLNFANENGVSAAALVIEQGTNVIERCSFFGHSGGQGGAISNAGQLTITNSTFAHNNADSNGGAIANYGTIRLESCTITQNSAGGTGGGIFSPAGASTELKNSIVAGNTAGSSPDIAATLTGGNNLIGVDPKLGALTSNGGPTVTMALLKGSPAIDAGSTSLSVDQRGKARPFGKASDIGAFEAQVTTAPVIQSVKFTPEAPRTDDPITAVVSISDAPGSNPVLTYSWTRTRAGQVKVLAETGAVLQTTGDIVLKGDIITLTVQAANIYASSEPVTASVTVVNTPIAVTGFDLKPRNPYSFETMVATARTTDLDRTKPTYTFTWKKNGVVTRTFTGKASQDLYNLRTEGLGDKGDVIEVSVVASDGESSASAGGTASIRNSIPVVESVALSPQAPTLTGTVVSAYSGRDADGDKLTRTYKWRIGTKLLKDETGSRLDLRKYSFVKSGDVVSVDVQLFDGEAYSKTITAKVTVVAAGAKIQVFPTQPSAASS